MTQKLLDTTVLIDLSRGNAEAAEFVNTCRGSSIDLFISVISAMEVIAGCRDTVEMQKAQSLIADFEVLQLSSAESTKAYVLMLAYSKSHGLSIPDALIAATALAKNLELCSDNERHFKVVPELLVTRPY